LHEEANEDGCHDVSFGIYILHEVKQLRNDLRDEEKGKVQLHILIQATYQAVPLRLRYHFAHQ
jgi:hypothetical protein